MSSSSTSDAFYPVRIFFTDTHETRIVHKMEEIPPGRNFKIIETNVKEQSK